MTKQELFDLLGLQVIFNLESYSVEDPEVAKVCQRAVAHTVPLWQVFGVSVRSSRRPIAVINKLARLYGREPVRLCRLGRGSTRGYVWGWQDDLEVAA